MINLYPSKTLVVAHAGAMNTPDDSLESIKMAIVHKADVVEIDVRFNEKNIPVLAHDKLIKGSHYETVYDAVSLLAKTDNIHLNCDMKHMPIEGLVNLKEVLEHFNFKDQMYFSGIKNATGELLRETFPGYNFVTDWSVNPLRIRNDKYLTSIVRQAKDSGFMGLNLQYLFITKRMIDICHQHDMRMYTWTVESKRAIKRLTSWGVDAITSRNPALVRELQL